MSVCLSKGLGAPIGSLVVLRDAALVPKARELRRRLGGGMRQAGVLAAAGLFALRHNITRLADDHARARRLAEAVAGIGPGLVDLATVETNVVLIDVPAGAAAVAVSAACGSDGVLLSAVGPRRLRAVTHLDLDEAAIDRAIDVLRKSLAGAAE
jgi:threonine aldolase